MQHYPKISGSSFVLGNKYSIQRVNFERYPLKMANIGKKIRQLSEDEKCAIKEAFQLLDTNKDGYLDYHEMKAAMRALGFEAKKAQVLSIMRTYDKSDGNKIGYEDFYYIMSDKVAKRNPQDELKYAFKLFTADSESDKITLRDLQRANQRIGNELTDEEMQSMIEEFDADLDGCINEDEFTEIMNNSGA